MSTFEELAAPFAAMGIPCFPLQARLKIPWPGLDFLRVATSDLGQVKDISHKLLEDREANCALLAKNHIDGHCFLEFDVPGGIKQMCTGMGQPRPHTLIQRSGRGGGHLIFRHTVDSLTVLNRSALLAEACACDQRDLLFPGHCGEVGCTETAKHHHHEWFSFRAANKYIVSAGSTHPNGNKYALMVNTEPIRCPTWVTDYVVKHTLKQKAATLPKDPITVSDEFDFDKFMEHYGLTCRFIKDDVWYVLEDCPGVDRRHEQSTLTAIFYDGETLGWNCFAQSCPTYGMTIGQLIRFLNETHEPYEGIIWEQQSDEDFFRNAGVKVLENDAEGALGTLPAPVPTATPETQASPAVEGPPSAAVDTETEIDPPIEVKPSVDPVPGAPPVQEVFDVPPTPTATTPTPAPSIMSDDAFYAELAELNDTLPDELPPPKDLALTDSAIGIEWPGDSVLYKALGDIASKYHTLPRGWLVPALIGFGGAMGYEDAHRRVKSNEYVALIGPTRMGKSATLDTVERIVPIDPGTVKRQTPSSDRGLLKLLSEDEPRHVLLLQDEARSMLTKAAIEGSTLSFLLNELWSRDTVGAVDKKTDEKMHGYLSMVICVTAQDPSDFAEVFGTLTTHGLYNRFLFGYSSQRLPHPPTAQMMALPEPKAVRVPDWVWEAKEAWAAVDLQPRLALTEHLLRVALITAGMAGDREITKEGFEAAMRFMEWQQRVRAAYGPGVARNEQAVAFTKAHAALYALRCKQEVTGPNPMAVRLNDKMEVAEENLRRLLDFGQAMNQANLYRKYGTPMINQIRRSMAEEGFIEEVMLIETKEVEKRDDKVYVFKRPAKKSRFVVLVRAPSQ
jgi:energy-coupling factor transporter ATP-binding protein EcfA2